MEEESNVGISLSEYPIKEKKDIVQEDNQDFQINSSVQPQSCEACGSAVNSTAHIKYCEFGRETQEKLDLELAQALQNQLDCEVVQSYQDQEIDDIDNQNAQDYKENFNIAMGDIDKNPIDSTLIRDIRGDGTRPVSSKEFLIVNDGDEQLHTIYGQKVEESIAGNKVVFKFSCGECKLAFKTPHDFNYHRKTQGCIGARMKTTMKRSDTRDQTLTCIKSNRHLLPNFFEDVIKPLCIKDSADHSFKVISKLFCDGLALKHPPIDVKQQSQLKQKMDQFIREHCKRPIRNILSKWTKGIQWITFSYSDAVINEAFFEEVFDLLQQFRQFAQHNMEVREEDALTEVTVDQIDAAINIKGTMCSLKFMTDWTSGLDKLTDLIDSESTNDYYKDMKINLIKGDNSMNTCFQYLIKSLKEGQDKEKDLLTRLKLYAKTIDLIEKEAVGKSVGSRIPLLLGADQHPDKDYYDQLHRCDAYGMSRGEICHIFSHRFPFDDLAVVPEKQHQFLNFSKDCINRLMTATMPHCKVIRTIDLLSSLSKLPKNICVISPQFVTIILADNKMERQNKSSFIGTQKSSKIMLGVNSTEIKKLEDFIKRHASVGAEVTVFLHNDPRPIGTTKKIGQLFVPPGVVRESKFQPLVPENYYFTTSQENLRQVELEGFEKLMKELKKRTKSVWNDLIQQGQDPLGVNNQKQKFKTRFHTEEHQDEKIQQQKKRETKAEMKELKKKAKIEGRANRDDKMNLFAVYYKKNCTNGETLKDLKKKLNLPETIAAVVKNPSYSQKIRLFINYQKK